MYVLLCIYINGGKASGAVSANPQSSMASAQARTRSQKTVRKSESQKEC